MTNRQQPISEQPIPECLNQHQGNCKGEVEFWYDGRTDGKSFPRCSHHWDIRLKQQQETYDRYPDSPIAPSWFDPLNAGERWDDDY